jgi:hypothetical protein
MALRAVLVALLLVACAAAAVPLISKYCEEGKYALTANVSYQGEPLAVYRCYQPAFWGLLGDEETYYAFIYRTGEPVRDETYLKDILSQYSVYMSADRSLPGLYFTPSLGDTVGGCQALYTLENLTDQVFSTAPAEIRQVKPAYDAADTVGAVGDVVDLAKTGRVSGGLAITGFTVACHINDNNVDVLGKFALYMNDCSAYAKNIEEGRFSVSQLGLWELEHNQAMRIRGEWLPGGVTGIINYFNNDFNDAKNRLGNADALISFNLHQNNAENWASRTLTNIKNKEGNGSILLPLLLVFGVLFVLAIGYFIYDNRSSGSY